MSPAPAALLLAGLAAAALLANRIVSVAAIAAVLLVAGVLLTWAHSYVHDQVHSQLAAEKIYFPTRGSASLTALPATRSSDSLFTSTRT